MMQSKLFLKPFIKRSKDETKPRREYDVRNILHAAFYSVLSEAQRETLLKRHQKKKTSRISLFDVAFAVNRKIEQLGSRHVFTHREMFFCMCEDNEVFCHKERQIRDVLDVFDAIGLILFWNDGKKGSSKRFFCMNPNWATMRHQTADAFAVNENQTGEYGGTVVVDDLLPCEFAMQQAGDEHLAFPARQPTTFFDYDECVDRFYDACSETSRNSTVMDHPNDADDLFADL